MRARYLPVDYENVHCLKAGIFDTKALRTCGKPSEAQIRGGPPKRPSAEASARQ